jgi:D-alanyl-D-alanine dipeptidase
MVRIQLMKTPKLMTGVLSGKAFGLLVLLLLLALLVTAFGCSRPTIETDPEIDPLAPLSYGHFVWMLMDQLGHTFRISDPVADALAVATERGYVTMSKDPEAPITREEIAQILMKVEQPTRSITPEHFQWQIFDLTAADSHNRNALIEAYVGGLLTTEDGLIHPKDSLCLDDARSILARLTNLDQRIFPLDQRAPHFEYKGLVDVTALDPSIVIDLKYATEDNFTGISHYNHSLCLLEVDTARMLIAANHFFQTKGYVIKIWDGYRPVAVQWSLYHATPDHLKAYVPAPSKYSQHSKGIAVDITLLDGNLQEIPMPTAFDDFSEKAHSRCLDLPQTVIDHRNHLITGMKAHGFSVSELEWWHFYNPEKISLPISEVELDEFIFARNQFYLATIQKHPIEGTWQEKK